MNVFWIREAFKRISNVLETTLSDLGGPFSKFMSMYYYIIYHWKALDNSFSKTYNKSYFENEEKIRFSKGSANVLKGFIHVLNAGLSDLRDYQRDFYMCSLVGSRSPLENLIFDFFPKYDLLYVFERLLSRAFQRYITL